MVTPGRAFVLATREESCEQAGVELIDPSGGARAIARAPVIAASALVLPDGALGRAAA